MNKKDVIQRRMEIGKEKQDGGNKRPKNEECPREKKNKGKDVKCGKRSSNKMSMMDDIKRKKEVGENETEIKKKKHNPQKHEMNANMQINEIIQIKMKKCCRKKKMSEDQRRKKGVRMKLKDKMETGIKRKKDTM